MMILRRTVDAVLLWLAVGVAILACGSVMACWPRVRTRPDAAMPIPGFAPELLGPTADQLLEQYNRRGPKYASPPDAIE